MRLPANGIATINVLIVVERVYTRQPAGVSELKEYICGVRF
jgi:hypothetical protein